MATTTMYFTTAPVSALQFPPHCPPADKTMRPAPVLNNVSTDEDVGLVPETQEKINLCKVIKLLTDPHSCHLLERHMKALNKINKHFASGFIMKDLVLVFKILNICADRVGEFPVYVEPMSGLLRLCGLPYLQEKSSDEVSYKKIAIECIEQLGYLMRVPSAELRRQICETLRSFYTAPSMSKIVEKYKPTSLSFNQCVVEKSDIAETLSRSLDLLDDDLETRLLVIDVLLKLSQNSVSNCNEMLKADAARKLCLHLNDPDPTRQLMFCSVELIWNLLENGSSDHTAEQLNDASCIDQLKAAFTEQMTQGLSTADKQLRNDILVLVTLVGSLCTCAPFVETGFAKLLALCCTFQDVKSHNALIKHLKLTADHEDFELKKLLINIAVLLSRDPACVPVLSEGHIIQALLSYVKAYEKPDFPSTLCYSPAQCEEITLQSMSALCTLAPLKLSDYMCCQGVTRLLVFLEWCIGCEEYFGLGNSFHAEGGRGGKRAHMRWCLRLVRSVVFTCDEAVLADFTDQGAISQFVCILSSFTSKKQSWGGEDGLDVEMQTNLLATISVLCQHDIHRKEIFGTAGVDMLVEYLKFDVRLLTSGLGHYSLLLSAINCAWSSVIGCYLTEDYFLEKEGVFLLIDLLELTPTSMHNQLLGCLLDLAENQKTLPHITVWCGNADISAPHLFCQLWRCAEQQIGVCREQNGAISDVCKPLIGQHQDAQPVISLPASCPSEAIVDVSENIRAKIYAIFCKIGFQELPGLTTVDHLTLAIIEHYLDLKVGEVWTEVMCELACECVRPTTPDREALEAISTAIQIRADQVIQSQLELVEGERQQDLIDEQEYYAQICENHRQTEKMKKNYTEFLGRTSNYMLLKAAKERQDLLIDATREQTNNCNSNVTEHRTDIKNLNVTSFCGRHVTADQGQTTDGEGAWSDSRSSAGSVELTQPVPSDAATA